MATPPAVITATTGGKTVVINTAQPVSVVHVGEMGFQGPKGATGPQGQWVSMTQFAFDTLPVKDPNTLYVIIG